MPFDLILLIGGISVVVITVWLSGKALLARLRKKAAEREWAVATRHAISTTPDLLDVIGPLSERELRELLKQIVFEISRSGALNWTDLVGAIGWVRKTVREQTIKPEAESPDAQ